MPSPADPTQTIKVSAETGSPVEWSSEDNYKFRMSAFREPLLAWLESEPCPISPPKYARALAASLRADGLDDLSISRPRSRLAWGVPVPGDASHTIYVWFDALINYLTVVGYPSPAFAASGAWPAELQVLGKDIVRFHAIYWPALLLAHGLPPPKRLLVHAHWTMGKLKMSKSRGNVADPNEAMARASVESVRAYLMGIGGDLREDAGPSLPLLSLSSPPRGADPLCPRPTDYNYANLTQFHKILSDQIGNLVLRFSGKKITGRLVAASWDPAAEPMVRTEDDTPMETALRECKGKVEGALDGFEVGKAVEHVLALVGEVRDAPLPVSSLASSPLMSPFPCRPTPATRPSSRGCPMRRWPTSPRRPSTRSLPSAWPRSCSTRSCPAGRRRSSTSLPSRPPSACGRARPGRGSRTRAGARATGRQRCRTASGARSAERSCLRASSRTTTRPLPYHDHLTWAAFSGGDELVRRTSRGGLRARLGLPGGLACELAAGPGACRPSRLSPQPLHPHTPQLPFSLPFPRPWATLAPLPPTPPRPLASTSPRPPPAPDGPPGRRRRPRAPGRHPSRPAAAAPAADDAGDDGPGRAARRPRTRGPHARLDWRVVVCGDVDRRRVGCRRRVERWRQLRDVRLGWRTGSRSILLVDDGSRLVRRWPRRWRSARALDVAGRPQVRRARVVPAGRQPAPAGVLDGDGRQPRRQVRRGHARRGRRQPDW